MGVDPVVAMGRTMLLQVVMLTAPLLLAAVAISLVINVIQVLTSLQDQTLSTVPRLLAIGSALFFLMPWMLRHLAHYTVTILSDFHGVLQ
jgi:flagellar biosynthetic protein FliQ